MGALKELLATGRTIILDSAMGTELQTRGVSVKLPLWSAQALIDKPDTVRHIHIDYYHQYLPHAEQNIPESRLSLQRIRLPGNC